MALNRPTIVPGTLVLDSPHVRELPADLLVWPRSNSYTRQPLAELHMIGSPPLVSALLSTLCARGARLAEPGEFTLRAFLAGRIDLAQAEAVLGVIDAADPNELGEALAQLAGGLTGPLHRLRESLVELLAHVEAGLDFVDQDIQFIHPDEIGRQLVDAATLLDQTSAQLAQRGRRDMLPSAVLIGWPNVGKSSLFNALAPEGAALVADQPGTTRDYLTAVVDLEGVGFRLVDTAGVEPFAESNAGSASEPIARAAQRLAAAQAAWGDVVVVCLDSTRSIDDGERALLDASRAGPQILVWTKCDASRGTPRPLAGIETSAQAPFGLEALRAAIRSAVVELARAETARHLTADRCGASLQAAGTSLLRAAALNSRGAGEELIATELRVALDELSRVVGAVYTDDILDRVFSRFCIGK